MIQSDQALEAPGTEEAYCCALGGTNSEPKTKMSSSKKMSLHTSMRQLHLIIASLQPCRRQELASKATSPFPKLSAASSTNILYNRLTVNPPARPHEGHQRYP